MSSNNKDINTAMEKLMIAAEYGNIEDVKELITKKANINKYSKSAFLIALKFKHPETALAILDPKIIKSLSTKMINEILLITSRNGLTKIVEHALLNPNIDINVSNNHGNSPLMLAVERGYKEIVKQLLNHNDIKVNDINNKGNTALMLAAGEFNNKITNTEMVEKLIAKNADVNIINNDGDTALMLAIKYCKTTTMSKTLKKNGAMISWQLYIIQNPVLIAGKAGLLIALAIITTGGSAFIAITKEVSSDLLASGLSFFHNSKSNVDNVDVELDEYEKTKSTLNNKTL